MPVRDQERARALWRSRHYAHARLAAAHPGEFEAFKAEYLRTVARQVPAHPANVHRSVVPPGDKPRKESNMPDLIITADAKARMQRCITHIDQMRSERLGYGPAALAAVERTEASLLHVTSFLMAADKVWPDGASPSLSFGGNMGGIVFGAIARLKPVEAPFAHAEIEWTFHS